VLASATLPASAEKFGEGFGKGDGGGRGHAAPGPLVGAGLPFAIVGLGAVWLLKRRRKSMSKPNVER